MRVTRILYIAILGAFALGLGAAPGTAAPAMDLKDCLNYGFEHSPRIKAASYFVAEGEENRKAVRADFMPGLSSSYAFSRIESERSKGQVDTDYLNQYVRNFSLTLSQTLYAGSRLVNAYDKAKLGLQKAEADKALAQLELAYNIETTFFELIGARQDVKVVKDSVARLEQSVASAKAFLEKSLISYTEVLSAEVDLADAQQQLSRAENNVNRKRVALFSLMNMPLTEPVRFKGGLDFFSPDYESNFDRCWDTAKGNRPDLESLAKQAAMAKKDADISLGRYLPMVRLDLGYHDQNRDYDAMVGYRGDRDQRNRYWSAGVTASWELFDGGRAWYNRKKSGFSAARVFEMIKNTQLSIREGIKKALFSIGEAKLRTRGALGAVTAAEENYKVEKRRLEAGLTTVPLLLDAQVRLTRAQGNYTQALLDYQLGRAELMFMMGESYKKVDNKGP